MNRARAGLGLAAIFGSTFFELVGYFMLSPMLLLRLNAAGVSSTVAGLFAATGWLGIFLCTPFASALAQRLGHRPALWLAGAVPLVAATGFWLTRDLRLWFVLSLASGMASGLRWVLAESIVAELSPAERRGRNVGLFATMVGMTFILGPGLLAWVGTDHPALNAMVLLLLVIGLGWSLLIPPLPIVHAAGSTRMGLHGLWQALRLHPVIMCAGYVGGFFETGIASILPLYGLAIGLGTAQAALLVSASGLGSAIMMLPAGMLADRWADPAQGRRTMMVICALVNVAATAAMPWVAGTLWLAWPIAFLWGGAGGGLYTLAMIDIGSREKGLALVNGTAVLVMSYTLGSLSASASAGALLDWAPALGVPMLLGGVALVGLGSLLSAARERG